MTTTTRGTAMRRKKPDFVHEYLDRRGKPRIYLRRPGQKRVPLIGPLYSDAFWKAYHAAMAGDPPLPSPGSAKTKPGSMSAVIVGYYGSAEFKTLAVSTKGNYRRILERFREKHGDKPVALLETRHVNAMIDAIADKPAAANHLRKRLHTVMEYAIGAGYRTDNPISRAKRVKYKTLGYRTWTESDIAAFRKRWALKTPQRVAMESRAATRSDASHNAASASLIVASYLRLRSRGAKSWPGVTVLCCRSARTACLRCQPVVAHSSSRMRPFSARLADR
jgi:hypothetical protein